MRLLRESSGWGGQSVGEIEKIMTDLKWDLPIKGVKINYIPDKDKLKKIKETGSDFGKKILQ